MKKRKLFGLFALVSLLAFSGALFLTKDKTAYPLYAEDDTSEPVEVEQEEPVEEQPEVVEEEKPTEVKKITEIVATFRDTFLIPLLSIVSGTTIFSGIVAIIVAGINRKGNKKIVESNEDTKKEVTNALETLANAINLVNEIIKQSGNINTSVSNGMLALKSQLEVLMTNVKAMTQAAEKMLEIKKCVVMLVEIQTKIVEHDPHAVSNGLAKQIKEINEQAAKML